MTPAEDNFFERSEFACKCGCGFDTVDVDTLTVLNKVRAHFNKPTTITSGCRCYKYNVKVGGSAKSQHVFARAADIKVEDVEPKDVADYVDSLMVAGGIGRYKTFTHVDTRTVKARWTGKY